MTKTCDSKASGLRGGLAACALAFAGAAAAVPITYMQGVFNTTYLAGSAIGLGNEVFGRPDPNSTEAVYTYITYTFSGDTDDIVSYVVNGTTFHKLSKGKGSLMIRDVTHDITREANFLDGELYVSSDGSRGIGIGSRVYPIYPYGLLIGGTFDPQWADLAHEFYYQSYGISCVGFASGPCKNEMFGRPGPQFGPDFPLHTDKGDFWISAQGITFSNLTATFDPVVVPEPAVLSLSGLALAALGWTRRRRR